MDGELNTTAAVGELDARPDNLTQFWICWYLMMRLYSQRGATVRDSLGPWGDGDLVPRWRDSRSLGIGSCLF